jgi:hypothetical protein
MEKQQVLHILSVRPQTQLPSMQCACNILYCHLWPVRIYQIFPRYFINGTIIGKRLLNITCVLIFSTNSVWSISYSKNNSARHYHKRTQVFTQSTPYSCHILIKLEFSRQNLKKCSNIKFHKNPSNENRDVRNFAKARNKTGYTGCKHWTVFSSYHFSHYIAECSPQDVKSNFLFSETQMFTFIFTRGLEPSLLKSSLEVALPHNAQ